MEKIVLLGGSYVSGILLDAAKRLKIPVFGVDANAQAKIRAAGIAPASEKEAAKLLEDGAAVYSNAEDVLPFLRRHSTDKKMLAAVDFFKDKAKTRAFSNEILGKTYFQEVEGGRLETFEPPEGKMVVVKPSCGFHSLGVRRVCGKEGWAKAVAQIREEMAAYAGSFDRTVVNADKFIVEEYFGGTEYAADAFFDAGGKPVVTAVYRHDFASEDDVRDCVYYTSREVLEDNLPRVQLLLERIGKMLCLRNFPVHFEYREHAGGIRLIEVNPLRFGGFGLADLARYAYGFDPYESFLQGEKPDWKRIAGEMKEMKYAFVVGQSPTDRSKVNVLEADYGKFKKCFPEILLFRPLDFTKYSFFATVLTRSEDLNEIRKFLWYDFGEYFTEKAKA